MAYGVAVGMDGHLGITGGARSEVAHSFFIGLGMGCGEIVIESG